MNQLFTSDGQNTGASTSILPMIQLESPFNDSNLGLISFRADCFDLLAVQGNLRSLFQHHTWKIAILLRSEGIVNIQKVESQNRRESTSGRRSGPTSTLKGQPQLPSPPKKRGIFLDHLRLSRILLFFGNFFEFIDFNWRLITLQYFGGFCHTLTSVSHGFTCVPHPEPRTHLPPHPIALGHPSVPALSTLSHASNLDWPSVSQDAMLLVICSTRVGKQCHRGASRWRCIPRFPGQGPSSPGRQRAHRDLTLTCFAS